MSVEALKQAEANQLRNIAENSGKPLEEWVAIIKLSELKKHGELVSMLKNTYSLGHGNANALVHFANKSSAASSANEDELVTEQYKGKENLKPIYDNLIAQMKKLGSDVEFSPKKTYVSVRRKKQFAIIQPSTKTRLDVGLNLKNVPAAGKLEASGSWNAMCSHRIKLEKESDVNSKLIEWIMEAYEQAG